MEMASFSCGASKKGGKCTVGAQGNGDSRNAFMTGAGENIVFESVATNLKESTGINVADPNGPVSDIYYWNFPRGRMAGNVSRESRTNADRGKDGFDAPATKPAASNRANYIGWTSPGGANLDFGVRPNPVPVPTQPTLPPTIQCFVVPPPAAPGMPSPVMPTTPPVGMGPCPFGTPGDIGAIVEIPNPAVPASVPATTPAAPILGPSGLFIRFLGASHEGHETN
jgi:hypothetical protein